MEIDITDIVNGCNIHDYVKPGYIDPGGKRAWSNAMADAALHFEEDYDREAFIDHFTSMGCSFDDTDTELKALMLQDVCHAINESTFDGVFDEEHANDQGLLCLGDDGRWYFYIGE